MSSSSWVTARPEWPAGEVYGLIDGYRDGAAAELIAIKAHDVTLAPTTIDPVQAASLPQAGLTRGKRCSITAVYVPSRP